MTIDLDLVQTSKPEKVAANTFQAYQASVSDAWDIEVSCNSQLVDLYRLGWHHDTVVEVVVMEVVVEVVVVDVGEVAINFESGILSLFLVPNPLDGGVTTEMID